MRSIKSFLFVLCLLTMGSAMGTKFYLLNKTGQPLYYKLDYITFGQTLLPVVTPTTSNNKVRKWFDERLQDKVKEGEIVNDGIARVKSYRLVSLELKKEKNGKNLITSMGDPRIVDMCQARQTSDCFGNTLKGLKARVSRGRLNIYQDEVKNIASPAVVVVTLDPKKAEQGKTGYIVTELAHTWGLIRRPKPFFYELQAREIPQ